ncbi:DUF934 domain-containing protein [Comamonas composti]|uniref:DUF934 domain-containing protein n=1 Tax=Comamonas composti TaxID=408558 RepID=UPI000402426F|nr:DUF934 domain-containing protein [Comamonas composti]
MNIIAANALAESDAGVKTLKIANDADLAEIATPEALQGLTRIELEFPKFTDGRAFSQAVLLRRRHGFAGDIRATGDVLIDQLVQMQRSGFSSAVLAPGLDADAARQQLQRFGSFYQGDALEPRPLFARQAGTATTPAQEAA